MKTQFQVEKMMCSGCSSNVERALSGIEEITSIMIDLESKTVVIEGDIDANAIATLITDAGYPTTVV